MSDDLDDPPMWLWMRVTEQQARELLAGRIDEDLKAMCRCMCDWQWDLARNAAKPIQHARSRRPRKSA